MIPVLLNKDIEVGNLESKFQKLTGFLKNGDFRSAEVKKIRKNLYRAKLDDKNRLLFQFARGTPETCLLLLEIIPNHQYQSSRFLRGAQIDESTLLASENFASEMSSFSPENKLDVVTVSDPAQNRFHVLDKILVFDGTQEEVLYGSLPSIIIGSAGSGKTALTLQKMKTMSGRILYVTLSEFLVQNSRNTYFANGFERENQDIDFLSFNDFLKSFHVFQGCELSYNQFSKVMLPLAQSLKLKNLNTLYEEFRGVLTGRTISGPYLSREEYLNLGIKQSIFLLEQRSLVYGLFEKYLQILREGNFVDLNILSFDFLSRVRPEYDFVVVDEVQDFTNIQLTLLFKTLINKRNFILSGDSNQIVHPNFFSWSGLKSMFYDGTIAKGADIARILVKNYRNSSAVVDISNRVLRIKNARFGSIDQESHYLIEPSQTSAGEVRLIENNAKTHVEINQKTALSTKFAVIVMRAEYKAEAKKHFRTPLLFSIQEAKGLEYENIILVNFISEAETEFLEMAKDVGPDDLNREFNYSRAKDKSDRSLEVYKFYINSLYVGLTRAIKSVYLIEERHKHPFIKLLGLDLSTQSLQLQNTKQSSADDWQREARNLELQGKLEQAEDIRKNILNFKKIPWKILDSGTFEQFKNDVLVSKSAGHKTIQLFSDYVHFYGHLDLIRLLNSLQNHLVQQDSKKIRLGILTKYFEEYSDFKINQLNLKIKDYGCDFRNQFNLTPLMSAAYQGSPQVVSHLLNIGANADLTDNKGCSALFFAFKRVFQDVDFASQQQLIFASLWKSLAPTNIKVQVGDKQFKIDSHQGEFFLFLAQNFWSQIRMDTQGGLFIKATQLGSLIHQFSNEVLPDHRRKRTYLNYLFAKNEVLSKNPRNFMLFWRIHTGAYIFNPLLKVLVGEKPVYIYDLLDLTHMRNQKGAENNLFLKFLIKVREQENELLALLFSENKEEAKKVIAEKYSAY